AEIDAMMPHDIALARDVELKRRWHRLRAGGRRDGHGDAEQEWSGSKQGAQAAERRTAPLLAGSRLADGSEGRRGCDEAISGHPAHHRLQEGHRLHLGPAAADGTTHGRMRRGFPVTSKADAK